MTINPDVRDQAYQFFLEEAPELLQLIEGVLLTLRYERSTGKIHDLMRAAHSIKGGAGSIGLETISTLAHHLETIFKALYNETLEIDDELEGQLLQAYDCLRMPLRELFDNGQFNAEQALAVAKPIFEQLEEQLEDSIKQTENYIPSSAELGINIAEQIFAVDVVEGLHHLEKIIDNSQDYDLVEELRSQIEVFSGFAELLNLPGFGAIAETTLTALDAYPDQALEIAKLALSDFQIAQQAVLVNHDSQGGEPSTDLLAFIDQQSGELSVKNNSNDYYYQEPLANFFPQLPEAQELDTEEEQISSLSAQSFTLEQEDSLLSIEELFSSELITNQTETDLFFPSDIIEGELIAENNYLNEQLAEEVPSLEDVFGEEFTNPETEIIASNSLVPTTSNFPTVFESADTPENLEAAIESIVETFETLPTLERLNQPATQKSLDSSPVARKSEKLSAKTPQNQAHAKPKLSVRVDSERLERMNNLVGELAISRSGVSLQNGQLQVAVQDLRNRFAHLQNLVGNLRELSDQMLVTPERSNYNLHLTASSRSMVQTGAKEESTFLPKNSSPFANKTDFDSLEMDRYGALHSVLKNFLEDMMQLEESVDDIALFAGQSNDILDQQQQMLTHLRDELIWARMLPLGEVLNRFPRVLRDLAATYQKPVSLKLTGTGVLVDKAVLEKIYDPLLHLLRNAFDHGIEFPESRRQQGKQEQGEIEIKAYHQGGQTVIEVKDNGKGIDLERIGSKALEMGILSEEKLASASERQLFNLIFEPGFSTAQQVSEISGRGVGLDVVRAQLRTLNGNISVTSKLGVGTTFTLRLPLTQTIAKLLVGLVGQTAIALPADSIEEIVVPKTDQIKTTGSAKFFYWRGQIVPTYRLADLLDYACPLPTRNPTKALMAVPTPDDWAAPLLVLEQGQQVFALQIDRLVTEQELVIKPFGAALTPPSYSYGCTILGGGTLVPVVNGAALLERFLNEEQAPAFAKNQFQAQQEDFPISSDQTTVKQSALVNFAQNQATHVVKSEPATVLVVDDAVTLRRTLALSLEKAGYRVLQAGDGREAIKRLEQNSQVKLVVCDIEMPNMNGFDFLSHRRQDPQLQEIPVVMLTSRGSKKHRWLAMHLGATAYFSKPYIEQEFLKSIKEVMVAGG